MAKGHKNDVCPGMVFRRVVVLQTLPSPLPFFSLHRGRKASQVFFPYRHCLKNDPASSELTVVRVSTRQC